MKTRLKIINPLLVKLGQLQQKKFVGFVEPVLGGDEGLLGLRSLGHIRSSFLQFVRLLILGLELEAFTEIKQTLLYNITILNTGDLKYKTMIILGHVFCPEVKQLYYKTTGNTQLPR